MTKKLPPFVQCVGAENGICEVGKVYSTLEPVGKYHTNKFWANTLKIFPDDFVIATFEEYERQVDVSDNSFDGIEVLTTSASFYCRTQSKKKRRKKKRAHGTSSFNVPLAAPKAKHDKHRKTEFSCSIPKYVKYIQWNVYADFWLGLKEDSVGKVFDTQVDYRTNLKWQTAVRMHPECYSFSEKPRAYLPSTKDQSKEMESGWSWERYNESVISRSERARERLSLHRTSETPNGT